MEERILQPINLDNQPTPTDEPLLESEEEKRRAAAWENNPENLENVQNAVSGSQTQPENAKIAAVLPNDGAIKAATVSSDNTGLKILGGALLLGGAGAALAAGGSKKDTPQPKAVEPKPVEPKPVEPKPVEPKPVEPKPVEPKPVEPKPVETKPVETKPVEPKPVEPKPVEPKPVEPKPVEPKPVEPKPVTPDLIAPVVSLNALPKINQANQNQTFTLSGSLKTDSTATLNAVTVTIGGKTHAATVLGNAWQFKISGSELSSQQGTQTILVNAVSIRGNKTARAETVSGSLNVDTQISQPQITINDVSDKLSTEKQSVTLSGSLNNVDADAHATVRVQINNGTAKIAKVSGKSWTLEVSANELVGKLGANRITATATATDKAGNTATHSASDDYAVFAPIAAPTVSVNSGVIVNKNSQKQTITFSGSLNADPNAVKTEVFVTVNGATQKAQITGQTWTLTVSGSELAKNQNEQPIVVKAISHDRLGNALEKSASGTYLVDTQISQPQITINDVTDKLSTEKQSVTLSGSLNNVDADARATVRVQINNGTVKTAKVSGKSWILDVPANEVVGKLGANRVTATATATDKVGNTATHSASDDYNVFAPTNTQIVYQSGKADTLTGITSAKFNLRSLKDRVTVTEKELHDEYVEKHFANKEMTLSDETIMFHPSYADTTQEKALHDTIMHPNIKKETTRERELREKYSANQIAANIQAAVDNAVDSDNDGVIDRNDKNPTKWDVSERDLRTFASLAYQDGDVLKKAFNKKLEAAINQASIKKGFWSDKSFFLEQLSLKDEMIGNWDVLEAESIKRTGLDYVIFGNGKKANGYENVVVAFRGTEPTRLKDVLADLELVGKGLPTQTDEFKDIATRLMKKWQPTNVYSTGQSLGGYLSQYFSAYTMQQTDERRAAFKHNAIFNAAKITASENSPVEVQEALSTSNQFYETTYIDDSDITETMQRHKSDSYVIDKEWVSNGIPFLTVLGLAAASLVNPFLWGATALAASYRGLGKYPNSTDFTFKSGEIWGKHDMTSFYEYDTRHQPNDPDNHLQNYFSKGYRIDAQYRNHDVDNDGLSDYQEQRLGTNVKSATVLNGTDTDGDGFSDRLEIELGTDFTTAQKTVPLSDDRITQFGVAATHNADTGEWLGAQGIELTAQMNGKTIDYTPNGNAVNLGFANDTEWQTWLNSGSKITSGSNGKDTLIGSDLAQILYGGAGDDVLQAGMAQTVLVGGAGNDTFQFTASNLLSGSLNIISDFTSGDKLDFSDSKNLFGNAPNFTWTSVFGDESLLAKNDAAIIWQNETNTLAYKAQGSSELHAFARFDDSQTLATLQAAIIA